MALQVTGMQVLPLGIIMTSIKSRNAGKVVFVCFVLLASASKTYIGSVLFRASAFTGAKLASGVLAVKGRFGS